MAKPVEPTGLPLVDGLSAHSPPTIDDYCQAAAEYIRHASVVGSAKSKAAQIRLSNALAHVTVADLAREEIDLRLAFAGEREVGGGLRSVKADGSEMSITDVRPTRVATRRCPAPPAANVNARPITPAVSTRRPNATSGGNTWVLQHEQHRPRLGRSATGPASPRSVRRRAKPQGASLPSQTGQPTAPANRSVSTLTGSFSTMSTDALRHQPEDPLVLGQSQARGSSREQDVPTLSPPHRHRKHAVSPTASSPSTSPRQPRVLNQLVAQQLPASLATGASCEPSRVTTSCS